MVNERDIKPEQTEENLKESPAENKPVKKDNFDVSALDKMPKLEVLSDEGRKVPIKELLEKDLKSEDKLAVNTAKRFLDQYSKLLGSNPSESEKIQICKEYLEDRKKWIKGLSGSTKIDKILDEIEEDLHWKFAPELPEEEKKEAQKRLLEYMDLIEQENELLSKDKLTKSQKKRLRKLESKIKKLQRKFEKNEGKNYEEQRNKKKILDDFTSMLGVDINKVKRLKTRDGEYIEILDIFFGDERKGIRKDKNSKNEPWIEYRFEGGQPRKTFLMDFKIEIFDPLGAYKEIKTLTELKRDLLPQCGSITVKEGDTFYYEEEVEVNGKVKKETVSFSISKIEREMNETYIYIDRAQRFGPKNQKKYTLGEFSKLLKKKDFIRQFETKEKFQKAIDSINDNFNQQFTAETAQKIDFTLPREKETKIVRLKDGLPGYLSKGEKDTYILRKQYWTSDTAGNIREDGGRTEILTTYDLFRMVKNGEISDGTMTEKDFDNLASQFEIPNMPEITMRPGVLEEEHLLSSKNKNIGDDTAPKRTLKKIEPEDPDVKNAEHLQPFNAVNQFGDYKIPEVNHMKEYFKRTYVLSYEDIKEIFKTIWENYKKKEEKMRKARTAFVGRHLPFVRSDFNRIKESVEAEEVNAYKADLDNELSQDVIKLLRTSKNKYYLKAALKVLSERGMLRFDDMHIWAQINRFSSPKYYIPIPKNGDPDTIPTKENSIFQQPMTDALQKAISGGIQKPCKEYFIEAMDDLYGSNAFNQFYSQNQSAYDTETQKFYKKGVEIGKTHGHQAHLENLLGKHKRGEYVNPHEYEGLLTPAMKEGYATINAKIYYLVEGFAAQNPSGNTLLNVSRLPDFQKQYSKPFPIFEYFVAANFPRKGLSKPQQFRLQDLRQLKEWFDEGNPNNVKPTDTVDHIVWESMLMHPSISKKLTKIYPSAQDIDHDDHRYYIPVLSEALLESSCRTNYGGKSDITTLGYAQVFEGFGQYLKTFSSLGDVEKTFNTLVNYIKFEGIMDKRFKRHEGFIRLSDDDLKRGSPPASAHKAEMNEVVKKIFEAYSSVNPQLAQMFKLITSNPSRIQNAKERESLEKEIDNTIEPENMTRILKEAVASDNGKAMMNIVRTANLYGIVMDEEAEKRKREQKAKEGD